MSQHQKILDLLNGGGWICTSLMYAAYIADPRTRLAELRKKHDLESRWCQSHKHEGLMKEWRIKRAEGVKGEEREWWKEEKYLSKPKVLLPKLF